MRGNTVSGGPLKSHAASVIGKEDGKKTLTEYAIDYLKANALLAQDLYNNDVGNVGVFLYWNLRQCVIESEFKKRERRSGSCGVQQVNKTMAHQILS